jgi:hypothetical protein
MARYVFSSTKARAQALVDQHPDWNATALACSPQALTDLRFDVAYVDEDVMTSHWHVKVLRTLRWIARKRGGEVVRI